ncbi:DUF1993 domain-containing protein [Pseudomonas silvicola]|nr:DUF1993 domain-containing protein [Pseudomonas silvicola]
MSISLYAASVPVFKQLLTALGDVLKKAEDHAAAKNIEPTVLLQSRLYPDMFPLVKQVQIAVDFAKGVSARLAGVEVPSYPDAEATFADLQALLAKVLGFVDGLAAAQIDGLAAAQIDGLAAAQIDGLAAAQIDGQEDREIVLRAGTPKEKKLNGQTYLLHYGLPQFFFHVTTAYDILRHNGVEVGKRDYMGAY